MGVVGACLCFYTAVVFAHVHCVSTHSCSVYLGIQKLR